MEMKTTKLELNLGTLLVMLKRPQWAGFNDSDLEIFRLKLMRDIEFWEVIVIENLMQIELMVLEANFRCAMRSHLGQVHRLHYVSMKECS